MEQAPKRALIIFIKNPELGKAKTRLAKSVGEEKALEAYKELLAHTHNISSEVQADKFLYYSSFIDTNDAWSIDQYNKRLQAEGDLGLKMKAAFRDLFDEGYDQIAIIGSDCAVLQTQDIENAFDVLNKDKVVVGPSEDGGYYLLGMRKFYYSLFEDKPWSQPDLFQTTVRDLEERKIRFSLVPELYDIDTAEDYQKWKSEVPKSQNV